MRNNRKQLCCTVTNKRPCISPEIQSSMNERVEMDCYFVRERVDSKEVMPTKIWTKEQLEDIFTKQDQFEYLRSKLYICTVDE